jgi:hypothetical protein
MLRSFQAKMAPGGGLHSGGGGGGGGIGGGLGALLGAALPGRRRSTGTAAAPDDGGAGLADIEEGEVSRCCSTLLRSQYFHSWSECAMAQCGS